tara:strand:+ start:582 stop:1484 length:903 start_codon:yes stop_codon:yes gene_type:complete
MTELTTIDTDNYVAMAKAMGIANEGNTKKQKNSTLPRFKINHTAIMGEAEVNGKTVNMEVVEGGTYKLEIPDTETYYAKEVIIRPFLQRFMYKRFVKGFGEQANKYIKTIMADNLNIDLKDNDGGLNCGKPAGYVQDFKSLPEKTQELIKQIKRVRVILGTVELVKPVNERGEEVSVDVSPFIWEIDNRDAFKDVGEVFSELAKRKRLPIQHNIMATTQERKLPSGAVFYLPKTSLDITKSIALADSDQKMFSDFMAWIDNYNVYIANAWAEKTNRDMSSEDTESVNDFIDIELEGEVAQ